MTAQLEGLTWEHPRAWRGLEAATDGLDGVTVAWQRQSLAGFEHEPIATLARRFDLLVIDHPGLGAALDQQALVPVDTLFDASEVASWRAGSVGPTWASYTLGGRTWALPLDAATQALVHRPDLLARPPATWAEVEELARRKPVALCLGGPHAGLLLLALAADRAPGTTRLLDPARGAAALELLRRLWRLVDREASGGDPIALHRRLAAGDDIVCCPLTYTYATYGAADTPHRLAWAAAPAFDTDAVGAASVLGGTGLAFSARVLDRVAAVRTVARRLMDPVVQRDVVAPLGGQPATRLAWESESTDRMWHGHYAATRLTLDAAYVRPRHDGWLTVQDAMSQRCREAISSTVPADRVIASIEHGYAATLRGREHEEVS